MNNIIDAEVECDGWYLYCKTCGREIYPHKEIIECTCGQLISCKWVFDRIR